MDNEILKFYEVSMPTKRDMPTPQPWLYLSITILPQICKDSILTLRLLVRFFSWQVSKSK